MTTVRARVKPAVKEALIREAGGKCANPGCPTTRTELHHIREWHVHQTHDAEHMVAVCPTCHDAIHHNRTLPFDDLTLYRWKGIKPTDEQVARAHIYIQPSRDSRLLIGAIDLHTSSDKLEVFDLSPKNRLSFRIRDGEIMELDCRLADQNGVEVVRVTNSHVKVERREGGAGVEFYQTTGHVRVTVPATTEYLPAWLLNQIEESKQEILIDGRIVALDINVLEPGYAQVQGCWATDEHAYVFTSTMIMVAGRKSGSYYMAAYGKGDPPRITFGKSPFGAIDPPFLDWLFHRLRSR